MEMWLLFSVMTMVSWGLWGLFPKLASRHISADQALVYELIGFAIAVLVVFALSTRQLVFHPKGSVFAICTGFFGGIGAYFFLQAFQTGKASTVVMFTALYPLVTLVLLFLFLNESITLREAAGVFFALVALVLFAK